MTKITMMRFFLCLFALVAAAVVVTAQVTDLLDVAQESCVAEKVGLSKQLKLKLMFYLMCFYRMSED